MQGGILPCGQIAGALTELIHVAEFIPGMVNEALFGRTGPRGGQYDGLVQTMAKTAARTVASGLGRQILRGVLGGLLGGKR